LSTQLTEEDLEAIAAEAPEQLVCPECGKTFGSPAALNGHLAAHRGKSKTAKAAQSSRERPKPKGSPSAGLDAAARVIVNKAVANTQTVGAVLAAIPFTAHTGLAIAGMIDPQTKQVLVRSRAVVAGEILLGQLAAASSQDELQRAAQILELLRRYNSIFEYSALGDVVGSIGVAAAVDARLIPPDFRLKVGMFEVPIVEATIGDVVAELERQGMYEPAPGESPPYPPAPDNSEPGAEVIAGDVTET
jgi:hypothetical protein